MSKVRTQMFVCKCTSAKVRTVKSTYAKSTYAKVRKQMYVGYKVRIAKIRRTKIRT